MRLLHERHRDERRRPSRGAIAVGRRARAALDKNLCRCGSHNRVVRAILDAR